MSNEILEISDFDQLSIEPIISVLMITYNHEKYIRQALDGILSQETNYSFEVVIGEDCSTDKTREIIESYQQKYPEKIRLLTSTGNVGVNKNFGRTYSNCRGQYIAICEGDDVWVDKNKLQKQVDFLSENSEYFVAYHDACIIDEEGEIINSSLLNGKGRDFSKDELLMTVTLPTQTLCFRNKFGILPDESMLVTYLDAFLISMFGEHGKAKYIGEITPALYRQHMGGIWSGSSKEKKTILTATTFYWLSVYHAKKSRQKLASNFASAAISCIGKNAYISRVSLIKCFLSIVFPNSRLFFKKIRNYILPSKDIYSQTK